MPHGHHGHGGHGRGRGGWGGGYGYGLDLDLDDGPSDYYEIIDQTIMPYGMPVQMGKPIGVYGAGPAPGKPAGGGGMSTGKKVAIAGGAIAGIGLIGYLLMRRK